MKINTKLFLIIIFLFSFALRIYNIEKHPSLLWDEAAIGYNAFSIVKTAKDEYGQTLPLIFKSFGDYKPGLYIYLTTPFVKLFSLSATTTRMPSVILGSLLPIFIFLLIKQINQKAHKTALLAALITAFNPYNIHFSRGAWETNILTFELVLASYFFFKYINQKLNRYLFFSSLIFALSLFTYQASKLISILLIIILFVTNLKIINQQNIKNIFVHFFLPLMILSFPIIYGLFFSSNANRLKVVSLFSYSRSQTEINQIIEETNSTDYNIFQNQYIFFFRNFLSRYFNHFSPRFLSFEGDWQNPRHSAPYIGVILYPSLIFLFIGLFYALTRYKLDKLNLFFLAWLLVAPVPASLTRDTIQAVRSMSLSIPLIYFISLGIYFITNKYKNIFLYSLIIFSYLISFIYYFDLYLNHILKKSPQDALYGYEQAMNYVIQNKDKYDQIIFTNYYSQPYIFYLFFTQYSPKIYQAQAKLVENNSVDVGSVEKIDNIRFKSVNFQQDIEGKPNVLGIFSYSEVLGQFINEKKSISNFFPLSPINNISTFYAYENK
jgi:4-amino-4-deoxy-L-arabinose transferase-like glycosyltransferase